MRILYLSSMDIRKKGADKTHLIEMCENLKNLGNEIILVAPNYTPILNINLNFPAYLIEVGKKSYFSYLVYHLKLYFYINKIITIFKPDLVYSRDIINGFLLYRKLKRKNIPFIIEKNSILPDELNSRGFDKWFVKVGEFLERLNSKNCNGVIAVTDGIKDELIKRYGITDEKIIVVPNGANHELFVPMSKKDVRKELGLDDDSFIVGFTGSFAPWQGLDLLVEAANIIKRKEKYHNIKYLLVGDGEMKEEILKLIQTYSLNSEFILPGRVDYEEVPKYINASDVVIVTKSKLRGIKTFSPLKFFEYAFCGVPIIFSDNIIGEELNVFKDKLGYEIEENNPDKLAEAIINVYENTDILRENISKVRNYLIQSYSWLSSAKKVEEFLKFKIQEGIT